MATLDDVKVGDKVILSSRYNDEIIEVTRVTKTQIICGVSKFNRTTGRRIGSDAWNFSKIKIATEKDIQKIKLENKRNNMVSKLRNYPYHELSYEELETVYNILMNTKKF